MEGDSHDQWTVVESKRKTNSRTLYEQQFVSKQQHDRQRRHNTADIGLFGKSRTRWKNDHQTSNTERAVPPDGQPNLSEPPPLHEPKRGGLLYIKPMKHVQPSTESSKSEFDASNEMWPAIEGLNTNRTNSNTEMNWTSIVKAPAKSHPRPIPKDGVDNLLSTTEVMDTGGFDEQLPKKKKKKKKEKEKLPEPQTLDLGAMIEALKTTKQTQRSSKDVPLNKIKKVDVKSNPRNVLDSSAPLFRRGKERENPKKKKVTQMRKTIIREREDRKKLAEEGQPIPSITDMKIENPPSLHNRKFRDYCTHLITPDINNTVEALLLDLVRFQDRVYKNEPLKLKTKRRYVCGLREVTKHLELNKLKCIIIPPNLDRIQSPGGINETVEKIITLSEEKGLSIVYALSRRRLAFVLKKKFHIGCVGIISYAGAEDKFKKLIELVAGATKDYKRKNESLLNPLKETSLTKAIPQHDSNSLEVEDTFDVTIDDDNDVTLLEDESEEDIEDEDDTMSINETVPVSKWDQLFPTSIQNHHNPSTPPQISNQSSKSFTWNVSATPFVPKSN